MLSCVVHEAKSFDFSKKAHSGLFFLFGLNSAVLRAESARDVQLLALFLSIGQFFLLSLRCHCGKAGNKSLELNKEISPHLVSDFWGSCCNWQPSPPKRVKQGHTHALINRSLNSKHVTTS